MSGAPFAGDRRAVPVDAVGSSGPEVRPEVAAASPEVGGGRSGVGAGRSAPVAGRGRPTPVRGKGGWWAAAGLVLLSLVPVLAGGLRLTQLATSTVPAEGARFVEMPVPVLAHIVGATVYCLVGAFQFVPGLRRYRWHRRAGRVLVGAGLAAALSGVWMACFSDLPASDGPLLAVFRIAFGTAMAACLVLGLLAVRRRRFADHDAWMSRAYAIGVAAGTQAVFLSVWDGVAGGVGVTERAWLHAAAWVVNLVVAEVLVRRRSGARSARAS